MIGHYDAYWHLFVQYGVYSPMVNTNALMMQRLLGSGYELHPLGSRKAGVNILPEMGKIVPV